MKQDEFEPVALTEYLLVLDPAADLQARIREVRQSFARKYKLETLPKQAVHLGLLKFFQELRYEEKIVERFSLMSMGFAPFLVELKNYGSLPTHSIFFRVPGVPAMKRLVKEIKPFQALLKPAGYPERKPHFFNEPHILVAGSLLPWQYELGWAEYAHEYFTGRFIADAILLLKRKEGTRSWQVLGRFELKNLPIHVRQASLF